MSNTGLKYEYVLSDLAKLGAGIGNHSNRYAKIIRLTILLLGRYVAYNQSEFSGKKAAENNTALISTLEACIGTLTTPIDSYSQCIKNLNDFNLLMKQNSDWFNICGLIEKEENAGIKETEFACIRFEKPWTNEINYVSSLRVFLIVLAGQKSSYSGFHYPIFAALENKVQDFIHYHMLLPSEPGPGSLQETDNTLETLIMYVSELHQMMQQIVKENSELRNELLKDKKEREPEYAFTTWQLAAVRMTKAVFKNPDDNEEDIIIRGALDRFLFEMKKKNADPRSYGIPDEIAAPHIFKYREGKLVAATTAQLKTAYGHISRF